MMRHAQIWKHISGLPSEELKKHVALMEYALPILGGLANKPDVTRKDLIKAVANAVAAGKMEASKAMATITAAPDDPAKLRGWLRERFTDNLSATVHAKAMLMGQEEAQGQPGAEQMPPAGMPQGVPVQAPQGAPAPMPNPLMQRPGP